MTTTPPKPKSIILSFPKLKKIKISKKLISKFFIFYLLKNPIHSNMKIANQYGYKKPICMVYYLTWVAIGNDVPGPGSVWLDTNIQFVNPVYENDQITINSIYLKFQRNSSLINLDEHLLQINMMN